MSRIGFGLLVDLERSRCFCCRSVYVITDLLAPEHTAVATRERQGGIVGPDAGLVALTDEATREQIPNLTRVLPAARGRH